MPQGAKPSHQPLYKGKHRHALYKLNQEASDARNLEKIQRKYF